jgi:hypothetical protein
VSEPAYTLHLPHSTPAHPSDETGPARHAGTPEVRTDVGRDVGAVRGSYVFFTAGPDRPPLAESLTQPVPPADHRWSAGRVVATVLAVVLVVALAAGAGFQWLGTSGPESVHPAVNPHAGTGPAASGPGQGGRVTMAEAAARDELAERPMRQFPESFQWPSRLSTREPVDPIHLPGPRRSGPAGVATGFPRSPEGTMAQLAAIVETALESGNLPRARAVIRHWTTPGGPTPATWSGVTAMAELLSGLRLPGSGSPDLAIDVTAEMGLIKGQVGPGFVVPCVDFTFTVTLQDTIRFGTATCARMLWTGDGWRIGPGAEPADAPALWPGTDAAYEVGYRDLRPPA